MCGIFEVLLYIFLVYIKSRYYLGDVMEDVWYIFVDIVVKRVKMLDIDILYILLMVLGFCIFEFI